MTFLLKKAISAFLMPLPFGLIWIALGLILMLADSAKRFRTFSLTFGFLIILLFSFPPFASSLLSPLQHEYTPLMTIPNNVDKVVVLGSGVSGGKNYPPNIMLGTASLSRLVEGIRVFKEIKKTNPAAKLILSGGRVYQAPAVADKMRNTAVMLGVDPKDTVLEDGSLDTRDEAVFLQKTLGTKPFVLVTSAFHMPRSMDLFEALGMHPIAAPTELKGPRNGPLLWLIPNTGALFQSDVALHEYLGILWAKMRGYIPV